MSLLATTYLSLVTRSTKTKYLLRAADEAEMIHTYSSSSSSSNQPICWQISVTHFSSPAYKTQILVFSLEFVLWIAKTLYMISRLIRDERCTLSVASKASLLCDRLSSWSYNARQMCREYDSDCYTAKICKYNYIKLTAKMQSKTTVCIQRMVHWDACSDQSHRTCVEVLHIICANNCILQLKVTT